MAESHVDHDVAAEGWRWLSTTHQPAVVLGPCPHAGCEHDSTSIIAWGPDFEHYTLEVCLDGCAGQCRAWMDDRIRPTRGWQLVSVP